MFTCTIRPGTTIKKVRSIFKLTNFPELSKNIVFFLKVELNKPLSYLKTFWFLCVFGFVQSRCG